MRDFADMDIRERPRRLLHREKPDGFTIEFSCCHIDELLCATLANIPFDSPTERKDWLQKCVADGRLQEAVISVDNQPVGLVTYAIVGELEKEMLISTAFISDPRFDYIPILKTFAVKIAKQHGCKFIRFHTARKGLVKKALAVGFHVSEIVCRLTLE